MESKTELGYWSIRGLAQPIRMLLGYNDHDFVDKIYDCGPAPDYDRSCWTDVKFTLGLDFPNLPYLIDGDVKLTQSNAILRYVGRKYKMDGASEKEKVRVDIMEHMSMDFRNGFCGLCYRSTPENWEEKSKVYKVGVKDVLQRFEDFIGDRKFFAGEELTFVDFPMYELLDQHKAFDESLLKDFNNLQGFMERFAALPKVAEFMKSDKCFKGPINNKMAMFK